MITNTNGSKQPDSLIWRITFRENIFDRVDSEWESNNSNRAGSDDHGLNIQSHERLSFIYQSILFGWWNVTQYLPRSLQKSPWRKHNLLRSSWSCSPVQRSSRLPPSRICQKPTKLSRTCRLNQYSKRKEIKTFIPCTDLHNLFSDERVKMQFSRKIWESVWW